MVFLVDKYKIKSLSEVICHKSIYKSLLFGCVNDASSLNEWNLYPNFDSIIKKMNDCLTHKEFLSLIKNHRNLKNLDNNIDYNRFVQLPNLLIYGCQGSGKKTLINILLENIFDESINNIKNVTYQIVGYGNTNAEVEVQQSNYHIVIEPTNSGLDKYLIHEIVKNYAQQTILNVYECKTPFRVVLINNIDNLSYYAQTSLRCTMEKYHKTCKFILCGYQNSKIIEPLRSRCLNIRIPSPNYREMYQIMFDITCRNNIKIKNEEIIKIIDLAEGNIKKAIWLLELYKSNIMDYELLWKINLEKVVDIIINFEKNPSDLTFNSEQIMSIRNIFYVIFITNITGNQIIVELEKKLFEKCDDIHPILLSIIMQLFGYYEVRIVKGKRIIIHLEALINSIFYHILRFKQEFEKKIML